MPGTIMVGPALTIRNILQRIDPLAGARDHVNKMAEFECHNLAQPGDVLVIEGVPNISNMGGNSAQTGKRQGEVGAIVQGGVRDVSHQRAVGYPIWASDITPVTGKWRIEAAEINGPVLIGGVQVHPGDLVVADDTGVCFIPRNKIMEVLEAAEKKARSEDARVKAIELRAFGAGRPALGRIAHPTAPRQECTHNLSSAPTRVVKFNLYELR